MFTELVISELIKGNEIPVIVHGNSMEPTYHNGELLRVAKAENYCVGDIIVFVFHGVRIVHRIVEINEHSLRCKGDHAQAIQEITFDNIIGKVSANCCK